MGPMYLLVCLFVVRGKLLSADKLCGIGLDEDEPSIPNLKLLDVNLVGVLYTAKLAAFYFNKQPRETFDRCLVLVSSIMAYVDTQGSSVYGAAKHGVRGAMCCLRRKGAMRVNALAPWYAVKRPSSRNEEAKK